MTRTGILILWIFIISCGYAQTTEKQVIQSPNAPKAIGPYSQAILVGKTLYISGQIAINPETGQMDTLNIETELRRVLSNLEAVLKEAGMTYENVVKATIFTTDLKNYKLINTIYGEHFKEKPPARETVQVSALPAGAHVEISCVAVK
jgi:2-iminobutanoate/2-iminopropanoate deaminase